MEDELMEVPKAAAAMAIQREEAATDIQETLMTTGRQAEATVHRREATDAPKEATDHQTEVTDIHPKAARREGTSAEAATETQNTEEVTAVLQRDALMVTEAPQKEEASETAKAETSVLQEGGRHSARPTATDLQEEGHSAETTTEAETSDALQRSLSAAVTTPAKDSEDLLERAIPVRRNRIRTSSARLTSRT